LKSAVVLFAHGSRDPEWATPFRAVERKLAAAMPDGPVGLAFLEFMQPALPEMVERLVGDGCERITIAPMFMAQGAHLKRDLSKLISDARERHPEVEFATLPAAGEAESVTDSIVAWITATTQREAQKG
jgi:sirohydrochlorin cobaltochelatase